MNNGGQLIVGSLVQQGQQNTPSQVGILQLTDVGFLNLNTFEYSNRIYILCCCFSYRLYRNIII